DLCDARRGAPPRRASKTNPIVAIMSSTPAPTGRRTAKEIIDQAISENRGREILLLVLAAGIVVVGCSVLVYGAATGQAIAAVAGAVANLILWPAMREARQIIKENKMTRMLEFPLSQAGSAKASAEMLRELYVKVFLGKS